MAARVVRVLTPPLLAFVFVVSLAAPAGAQRLAFGVTSAASTSYGIVDLATGVSTPATADEAQLGAVFTSDGQLAVRVVAAGLLSVRHMPSGQQFTVPSTFQPRLAHPRRHTIFGAEFGAPARLDARGLARWDVCGFFSANAPVIDLSVDGRHLYAACPNGDLVAIDTESGAEVRRLGAVATSNIGYGGLAVNAAETEAVLVRGLGGGLFDLVRLDLATGQTLSTRPGYSIRGATVAPTPDHTRALLTVTVPVGPDVLSFTTLVDAVTLADVLGLASSSALLRPTALVSPDGHAAFAVSRFPFGETAAWIDIDSGTSIASTSVPPGYSLDIGYRPVSLPPALSPAQVTAGSVTLSWTLPEVSPMATGYVLEVGDRAGAANLGRAQLGPGPTFSVAGVPPGRYFVRLRALNANGQSPPSNEIVVDVP